MAISYDEGTHWRASTVASGDLYALAQMPDTDQIWAAGTSGRIVTSDDDGDNWNAITCSGTTNDIYSLGYILNGERVYAIGDHTFQIFAHFGERWHIGSIELSRALSGLESRLTLPGLALSSAPAFTIRAAREREVTLTDRVEIPVKAKPPTTDDRPWELDFDLASLDPRSGEAFNMEACVKQPSFTRCIPLPVVTAVPWVDYQKHKEILGVSLAIAALAASLTVLLFTYPLAILALYRRAWIYEAVGKGGPGATLVSFLLSGTMVPFFAFHRRTLDAWVQKYRAPFRLKLTQDSRAALGGSSESHYLPLPVDREGQIVDTPRPETMFALTTGEGAIEIVGPGGIGKTTLLRQFVSWTLDGPEKGQTALPLIIEPFQGSLSTYLQKKLKGICEDDFSAEFVSKLLELGRIIPFIDAFSELEPEFRTQLSKDIAELPVRNLVLSSRETIPLGAARVMTIRPQPLDPSTLLSFVISVLTHQLPEDLWEQNTGKLQYQLSTGIDDLSGTGMRGSPITPLLARLYVERAIALMVAGRPLDGMPSSIGEVYFEFILQLLRTADATSSTQLLSLVKDLAKLSLGDRFTPGRFNLQHAVGTKGGGGGEALLVMVSKLISAGLLTEEKIALQVVCQFVLDPVAEFCCAYAYAEECGHDMKLWGEMKSKLDGLDGSAVGFRTALVAVIRAWSPKGLCSADALPLFDQSPKAAQEPA